MRNYPEYAGDSEPQRKKEIVKGNDEDERITEQQQWNNAHNPTLHKAETYCSANHMAFGNKHYAALSVSVVG